MQWLVLRAIQRWSWEQASNLSGLGAKSFPWAKSGTGPQISGEVGSLLSCYPFNYPPSCTEQVYNFSYGELE